MSGGRVLHRGFQDAAVSGGYLSRLRTHGRIVAVSDFGRRCPEPVSRPNGSCPAFTGVSAPDGLAAHSQAGMMAGGDGHTQFVNQLLVAAGRYADVAIAESRRPFAVQIAVPGVDHAAKVGGM